MPDQKSDILQGWKEIASYVSRDERTVKRWEKQRGLPVRRMPGKGRANVYAVVEELDAWLSSAPPIAESESELDAGPDEIGEVEAADDAQAEAEPETDAAIEAREEEPTDRRASGPVLVPSGPGYPFVERRKQRQRLWHEGWLVAAAAVAGLLILIGCLLLAWRLGRTKMVKGPSGTASQAGQDAGRALYSSPVPEVDELYLRGVYSYEKRTPESLNTALTCFNSAIDKDPKYAPAYAGLANTYNLLREYAVMPADVIFAKAREAAEKAIVLDPKLPEAHAALGFALFFGYLKPADAEREFKTAIALDPNAGTAHLWYGSILTHETRYEEALEELNIAYRLQPSSAAIASSRAFAIGLGGHRDQGADLLQEMINQDRDVSSAHIRLAFLSLVTPREIPRFLDASRRRAEIVHNQADLALFAVAERAYKSHGEAAMWQAIIQDEKKRHPNGPTWRIADAEAALGDTEGALRDLAVLVKERELNMIAIKMDPLFVGMHHDPRFVKLTEEMGLPKSRE